MSRERSNTNDIMEAMEQFTNPKTGAETIEVEASDCLADEIVQGRKRSATATSSSFDEIVLDWNSLFSQADCDIEVAQLGLRGLLRGCPFRSICWKLFLGILNEDKTTWCAEMKRHRRQYEDVHSRFLADPRLQSLRSDVTMNNPLSLDTESPWNKYFQDEELRATIVRDVERTFPEVDYFQEETVQAMLTDILFCYCRVHTALGYRQGMHELLAILLLVVDCDKRDSSNISPGDPWAEEMLVLLDAASVEADAYILFSALMSTCHLWFENTAHMSPDGGHSTPLAKKLERIQDRLLKKEDPVLHAHFQKYSVAPQLYALRWVRLLFSREFPLLDVLVLWDAILAYSPNLDLVDYVALSMLLVARQPLMMGNESSTIGLLLNFPHVPDIHLIVQKALFLRNPKVHPRPPNWQLEDTSTARAPVLPSAVLKNKAGQLTQGARSLAEKVSSTAIAKFKNIPAPRGRTGVGEKPEGSPRSPPRKQGPNISQRIRMATNRGSPGSPPPGSATAAAASGLTEMRTAGGVASTAAEETSLSPEMAEDFEDMSGDQMSNSPSLRLTKLEAACVRCSRHMNLYLRILQSDVLTLQLPEECEDRVLRSVAGLKQVRDVLCGVLSCDEVQFQSLAGVVLPESVTSSDQGLALYDDYGHESTGSSSGLGEAPTTTTTEQQQEHHRERSSSTATAAAATGHEQHAESGGSSSSEHPLAVHPLATHPLAEEGTEFE